jgi:hypothetical protein
MYVISFTGLFEYGYVLSEKNAKLKITVDAFNAGIKYAKKYRYKFYAKFVCWILNKSDENLRTFTVVKI